MVQRSLKRNALRALPARSIIDAIAAAARQWSDPDLPSRRRSARAIAERTGYSASVVDHALHHLFEPITGTALNQTIAAELGSVDVLDGFVQRDGRPDTFAAAVGSVCLIASRTTIGVTLLPAIYALCAKCDVMVKDREDHLIAAFFGTLAERHEAFSDAARAKTFSSEASELDIHEFDCVVAFGKDATLARIRSACAPNARFVGFGSRASAGYITAGRTHDNGALTATLEGAARDFLLYDSEGCMSLHVLFVEEAAGGGRIAELFSAAVERESLRFPIGTSDLEAVTRRASVQRSAAFRASMASQGVLSDERSTHAIVFDPPRDEPPPFTPRSISVIPVHGPSDAASYLKRHRIALEAFALSERRADLVDMAVEAGAVRLTRFGAMQQPPASGNHGGRPRILDFVRWIDREL